MSGRLNASLCLPQGTLKSTTGVCLVVFLPSIQTSDQGTELTVIEQSPPPAESSSATGGGLFRVGGSFTTCSSPPPGGSCTSSIGRFFFFGVTATATSPPGCFGCSFPCCPDCGGCTAGVFTSFDGCTAGVGDTGVVGSFIASCRSGVVGVDGIGAG